MTEVRIVADSLNARTQDRLTTFLLTYPRYVHAELMTHRVFSRNSASSRAIPVLKFRKDVTDNPVIPYHWGSNKPGMQAGEELDDTLKDWHWPALAIHPVSGEQVTQREFVKRTWLAARDLMLGAHVELEKAGLHKQVANRIIEPWFHIQVLVSATEYQNWFSLRCHSEAHPDIQVLADGMLELYVTHQPAVLQIGDWHLPFGDQDLDPNIPTLDKVKICTARAARVSYEAFDGKIDFAKDIELHDRLKKSGHWSPFEHPAEAARYSFWSGNFRGFKQYRKTFDNENRQVEDLNALWEQRKKERGLTSLIP